MSTYSELLKDPRWQKKRLEILERDEWTCQICFNEQSTLVVHHKYYTNDTSPWDYPNDSLVTLCEDCHINETTQRPLVEKLLLQSLNRFLLPDLIEITKGFHHLPKIDVVEYFSLALNELLTDNKRLTKFINSYSKRMGLNG